MSAQATEKDLAHARKILASTPLIDGHNDLAWAIREDSAAPMDVAAYDLRKKTRGHTDLDRLKKGMIGGQFWSIYIHGEPTDGRHPLPRRGESPPACRPAGPRPQRAVPRPSWPAR